MNDSPLRRSIGLSGIARWLVAAAGVIAAGAAFSAGRWAMATAFLVFAIGAVVAAARLGRAARQ